MKIYWIRAQAPRRVLAVARHLGIAAEFIQMGVDGRTMASDDYGRLNPNRKAPVLVDGDFVLWEALAINAYLCGKAGSDMWPTDAAGQVELLRWLSWNDQHWGPSVAPFYFEHVVKPTFDIGAPDRDALPAKVEGFRRFAGILDAQLAGSSYVALGRLTIADFHLASMAAYWRVSEMPMQDFPNIVRWLDGLMQLPAWASPWPDREGDAFIREAAKLIA